MGVPWAPLGLRLVCLIHHFSHSHPPQLSRRRLRAPGSRTRRGNGGPARGHHGGVVHLLEPPAGEGRSRSSSQTLFCPLLGSAPLTPPCPADKACPCAIRDPLFAISVNSLTHSSFSVHFLCPSAPSIRSYFLPSSLTFESYVCWGTGPSLAGCSAVTDDFCLVTLLPVQILFALHGSPRHPDPPPTPSLPSAS